MMRKYECLCYFNPELDEAVLKEEIEGVKTVMTKAGVSITKESTPEKATIAYEVKKFKSVVKVLIDFESDPEAIALIRKGFALKDALLRSTIILQTEKLAKAKATAKKSDTAENKDSE